MPSNSRYRVEIVDLDGQVQTIFMEGTKEECAAEAKENGLKINSVQRVGPLDSKETYIRKAVLRARSHGDKQRLSQIAKVCVASIAVLGLVMIVSVREPEEPRVEILEASLAPRFFRGANGNGLEAIVTWKNTGTSPVRTLFADIQAFDKNGERVYEVNDYTIYVAEDDETGVLPGHVYTDPAGQGHGLPTKYVRNGPASVVVKVAEIR